MMSGRRKKSTNDFLNSPKNVNIFSYWKHWIKPRRKRVFPACISALGWGTNQITARWRRSLAEQKYSRYSSFWYCLVLSGTIWYCLALLAGAVWYYLVLSGNIWYYLAVWYYLMLSCAVGYYLILAGALWYYLVLSGIIWYCLVLSGTSLVLSGSVCY